MLIIFPPQSVNEMTDLLLNYALKFPVDAALPAAAAEVAGQWVVKQWPPPPPPPPPSHTSSLPHLHLHPPIGQPANQPASPSAAATGAERSSMSMGHWGLHLAARRTRTGLLLLLLLHLFSSLWFFFLIFDFWLFTFCLLQGNFFFWIAFAFRNFHLWFANMGSSCGFSRGIIAVLLLPLLLEGKLHHQLHC